MQELKRTELVLEIEGDIAEIRLVPPEGKPPTLDEDVLRQLDAKLDEIEQSSVKLTYLTSASATGPSQPADHPPPAAPPLPAWKPPSRPSPFAPEN